MRAGRLVKIGIGLAIAAVLAWTSVRWYAKYRITAEITSLVGATVEMDRVELGLNEIEIHGLQIGESGPTDEAWLRAGLLQLDLGLVNALKGQVSPDSIRVVAAVVRIELDEHNKLVVDPARWNVAGKHTFQSIDVSGLRVEVHQPGRTPFVATGINLQAVDQDGHIRVSGRIEDALRAAWTIESEISRETLATRLQLSCAEVELSTDELSNLPLVPDDFQGSLRIDGKAQGQLAVAYQPGGDLQYRGDVNFEAVRVGATDTGFVLSDVAGALVVEDGVVSLTGVEGDVLGGRLSLDGEFALADGPIRGRIRGRASEVNVESIRSYLPRTEQFGGVLHGHFDVQVEWREGSLHARGIGAASIDQATVAGLPLRRVDLNVQTDDFSVLGAEPSQEITGRLSADVEMADVEITEIAKALGPDGENVAIQDLSGRLGVRGRLDLPLDKLSDPHSYEFRGAADVTELRWAGVYVREIRMPLVFQEGTIVSENIDVQFDPQAHVNGQARIELITEGKVEIGLTWTDVPASTVRRIAREFPEVVDGLVSGHITASAPLHAWHQVEEWEAAGDLVAPAVTANGLEVRELSASLRLARGTVFLDKATASLREATIEAQGQLGTIAPFTYSASFSATSIDAGIFHERFENTVAAEVAGALEVSGNIDGTLSTTTWNGLGRGRIDGLRFRDLDLGSPAFRWQLDTETLKLTDVRTTALAGQVDLAATIPLTEGIPSQITGSFADVVLQPLLTAPDKLPISANVPISGQFRLSGVEHPDSAVGSLRLQTSQVEVYQKAIDDVVGNVTLKDQSVSLQLSGKSLGGTATLHCEVTTGANGLSDLKMKSQLELKEIQIDRLSESVPASWNPSSLRGTVNGEFDLELSGPSFRPAARGTISSNALQWQQQRIAEDVRAEVTISDETLRIRRLDARMGTGSLSGELTLPLDNSRNGAFQLSLRRVPAQRLLATWPAAARHITGAVDLILNGRLGEVVSGTGRINVSRAKFGQLPVRRIRGPFGWEVALNSPRARVRTGETEIQLARGRVIARTDFELGRRASVRTRARAESLDLRILLGAVPGVRLGATGRLNGELELQGRNVRSWDDLSGTYQATIDNSQALLLPVVYDVARVIRAGQPSARFDTSEAKGKLANGVVFVEQARLANQGVQMEIEGKIWMSGRLGLDVTAHLGQFTEDPLLYEFLRIALISVQPVGIGLVIQVNDFLERRLIFARVGGTIQRPTVQPRPAEFLEQEAILFFLDTAAMSLIR